MWRDRATGAAEVGMGSVLPAAGGLSSITRAWTVVTDNQKMIIGPGAWKGLMTTQCVAWAEDVEHPAASRRQASVTN